MEKLIYRMVLRSQLPHRELLTIPPIYMGMQPLPLKGVLNVSRTTITGIDKGGIGLRLDEQDIRKGGEKNSRSNVGRIRIRKANNPSKQTRVSGRKSGKAKKQKRIGGKFAK